ncbi:multidrug resistance-associated protein 4-like [Centruroides sculpturatus]|uniref:multidrug resistance-associated protein 4-like n=1 Tax=Centruroides sculpturatus TaxID=218467 RepID=UPI000C6E42DC|nr:multidrug resistance-associated protein 4-like [Centruroides sculpturatus]
MEKKEKINIYDSAGVFSRMFLWWIFPIISKGRKRFLKEEDLLEISKYHTSEYLGDKLQKEWNKELQKKNSNILKAVLRFLGLKFSIMILYVFIQDIVVVAGQSHLLGLIIHYFDNRLGWNEYNIYVALVGFFAVTAVYMFVYNANIFTSEIYGMKIKVAFCTIIYRKAIRLSSPSLEKSNVGQMVNLLANDVSKFLSTLYGIPYLVTTPFFIITTIAILWQYYGWTILVGYSVIFLFIPIQLALGKLYSKLRLQAAMLGDERLNLLNEIIADMRLIKMYTWELPYSALLKKIRVKEMNKVRMFLYAKGMSSMLAYPISKLFTSLAYLAFFFNGGQLNPEIAFITMTVSLYIFISTVSMFSLAINNFAEILVSLKRLQAFLLLQEKDSNASKILEERESLTEFGIWVDNVTAAWKKETTLNDISLNVQPGELLTVIGPVGSGKTSLLMSILGEIPISSGRVTVKGKIAYASQEAWVFNDTIRENILFGEEYQEDKYRKILYITALEKDISLFPKGDLTIVGERGVIMSGGQKARINLARALYVDADIFLFDDPLSAVDVPVGKHIFEKCIMEYLKEKICILVTHQVQFLNSENKVLVLCKHADSTSQHFCSKSEATSRYYQKTARGAEYASKQDGMMRFEDEGKKIPQDDEGVGKVGLSVYREYFNAGKGFFFKSVLLVILIVSQANINASDFWLVKWLYKKRIYGQSTVKLENITFNETIFNNTGEENFYYSEAYNVYVYFGMICAGFLTMILSAILMYEMFIAASIELHNNMFQCIIRTPISFLDNIPVGSKHFNNVKPLLIIAILNGFTKNAIDGFNATKSANCSSKPFNRGRDVDINGTIFNATMFELDRRVSTLPHPALRKGSLLVLPLQEAFTDGSKSTDGTASAFVIFQAGEDVYNDSFAVHPDALSSKQRFCEQTHKHRVCEDVCEDVYEFVNKLINIFTDSAAAVAALGNKHNTHPVANDIFAATSTSFNKCAINWIKGHSSIPARSPVFSHLSVSLYGLTTIRAFKAESKFKSTFNEYQDMHTATWFLYVALNRWVFIYGHMVCFINVVITVIIFSVSIDSDNAGSQIALVMNYGVLFIMYFPAFIRMSSELQFQMNSVKRILNYTKLKSEASYESSLDKQPPPDWPQKGEIHFDNVSLQYSKDKNTVLKHLTFRIYSGEKIGIVGRTGAGKTSIIASLFRMTEPTGTITIDGVDVKDIGLRDLRSKISIIPQDPMLFTGPLRRNIDPFNEYSEENLWQAVEEVQLKEVISKLPGGLDTHLSEGGRNFSVGERQLICLARTILRQNKILVMDEATSNIDKRK